MKQRIAGLGTVVGAILVAAACSSSHHISAPTTTTTTAPNPDVIPAVITPAYVDAVFKVLEHIDGNASRELISAKAVTPQVLADIRSIYNDPLYTEEVRIAHESLQGDLSNVRQPPGDVVITVVSLISSSARCIFVRTSSDYSAVVIHPSSAPASEYWSLSPKQPGNDPQNLNPSAWALSYNRTFAAPTSIPNQCAAS